MLLFSFLALTTIPLLTGCGGGRGGVGAARTGIANLTWDAPTQNADGTTLTQVAGYRVNFGEASLTYPSSVMTFGTSTTASIGNLPYNRTIYFAVAAFNIYGYVTSHSNELQITLPNIN
jgi:hypothetical protein